MKHVLPILLALSGLSGVATAQLVDFDAVVPPAGTEPETFGDYLVQQAYLNNPSNDALAAEVAIADVEIRRAKLGWLDQINANVNFTSQQQEYEGFFGLGNQNSPTYLGPGLNYGVSANIGGIVNNGKNVTIAEQQRRIAEAERQQEKLQLRAVVLTRLEQYDAAREVLRIRRQSEIDAETNYTLVRNLFEQNKAQFEDLAAAGDIYNRAVEATAIAESRVRVARYAIEEIVGEPWNALLIVRRRYETQDDR